MNVKKIFLGIVLILSVFKSIPAAAEADNVDGVYNQEVYKEQYDNSGAEKLFDDLPKEAKNSLEGIGVNGADFNEIIGIKPEVMLEKILATAKKSLPAPLRSISMILAVTLLNAILTALKISIGERSLAATLGVVSTMCVCMIIVTPIVGFIGRVAAIIKGGAGFLFCYIPIMVGVMVASGQAISSVAFSSLMVTLGDVITQLCANFLVPLLNIFLTVSVVCAISPRFNFSELCGLFSKITKWVLGFTMTIFSGILTTKSIIGAAADSVNSKTMKFVLSSFVPIVGSALGDAFSTVQGCIKILKSGIGAFFIIAVGFIFLPAVVECIVWSFAINICAVAGDIFELPNISMMLKNIGKVVSTLMAVVLCIMTILIISTVLVLSIGGGGS